MRLSYVFLVLVLLFTVSACENKNQAEVAGIISTSSPDKRQATKEANQYLAYKHQLSIELAKDKLVEAHTQLVEACEQDQTYNCVVLDAKLNSGRSLHSRVTLRLKRAGVSHFTALASEDGNVAAKSTIAEDLSEQIVDSVKRIEMLESYRDKLSALEEKSSEDINALIKITSELAKTQNELEFAQGRRAKLLQRVESDIFTISLSTPYSSSGGRPIMDAIHDFSDEFQYAVASVISAAAYVIPWSVFLLVLFFMLRAFYRLIRRSKRAS